MTSHPVELYARSGNPDHAPTDGEIAEWYASEGMGVWGEDIAPLPEDGEPLSYRWLTDSGINVQAMFNRLAQLRATLSLLGRGQPIGPERTAYLWAKVPGLMQEWEIIEFERGQYA